MRTKYNEFFSGHQPWLNVESTDVSSTNHLTWLIAREFILNKYMKIFGADQNGRAIWGVNGLGQFSILCSSPARGTNV